MKLDVEGLEVESFSPEPNLALVPTFTPLGQCTGCDSTCGILGPDLSNFCY